MVGGIPGNNWQQIKIAIQKHWGKLTEDDLELVEQYPTRLIVIIEKRYGTVREQAEIEVSRWSGELHRKLRNVT